MEDRDDEIGLLEDEIGLIEEENKDEFESQPLDYLLDQLQDRDSRSRLFRGIETRRISGKDGNF